MSVVVYIIQQKRPGAPVERFMAHIKETASGASWAIVDRLNGRRFKVGSTAFLTPEAAEKRRQGLAAKALQAPHVRLMDRLGFSSATEAAARVKPPRIYTNQIVTR